MSEKARVKGNFELSDDYMKKAYNQDDSIKDLEKEIKILQETLDEELEEELEEESGQEPIEISDEKIKEEVDKYLNNKKSIDILKSYKLKLPSKYKDKSMADFQKAFNKGMKVKVVLKNKIDNYTKEKEDSFTGISMAVYNPPNPKSRSSKKSSEPIEKYNTMAIFEANMRGLRS